MAATTDRTNGPAAGQSAGAEVHSSLAGRKAPEPLIFELSVPGRRAGTLPPCDVPARPLDELLPAGIRMIHGPGCPVCVTPLAMVDKAVAIAARPGVIFTSYGDMLRVPGSTGDLVGVKARGGDVRVVYSPLDAVRIARTHPDRQVVFFAVGFETTVIPVDRAAEAYERCR